MIKNRWIKWSAVLIFIFVVVFVVFLAVAHKLLVTQTALQKADAIIVISGGRGERVDYAAQLYKNGYADTVIISGCPGTEPSIAEAHFMKETAVEKGVPENRILLDVLDRHGQGTGVQAHNIRKMIEKHGFRNVILVTTDFHTARSQMIFDRAFKGLDVNLQIAHPRIGVFDSSGWWTERRNLKIVTSEVIKYVWYWISYS